MHQEYETGNSFFAGLCAGAFVGAGIALLLAPRTGSQLRDQLADSAAEFASVISKTVGALTDRGQDLATQVSESAYATGATATHVGKGLATLGEMAAAHGEDWRVAIRG